MTRMRSRLLLAATSLVLPPAAAGAVRSGWGRGLLILSSLTALAVFFALYAGPGLLIWLLSGCAAAAAVLLSRRGGA